MDPESDEVCTHTIFQTVPGELLTPGIPMLRFCFQRPDGPFSDDGWDRCLIKGRNPVPSNHHGGAAAWIMAGGPAARGLHNNAENASVKLPVSDEESLSFLQMCLSRICLVYMSSHGQRNASTGGELLGERLGPFIFWPAAV